MPAVHTIHTYAKINLILQVAPPISDPEDPNHGMHPICSWMHSINLCDEINIESSTDNRSSFDIRWLYSKQAVEWDLESDLIYRAHTLLESEVGRPLPINLKARKKIPSGGGLGGGSSNAAGTLMGLNDLFELGYSERELQQIALKLGSDIPFFIDFKSHEARIPAKPGVVTGIGEKIERTPRHADSVCLLIPKFGCSTPEVYRVFDSLNSNRVLDFDAVYKAAMTKQIKPWELENDLKEPAMIVEPGIKKAFEQLERMETIPLLSGSGSTMYVLGSPMRSWIMNFREVLRSLYTIEYTSLA